MAHFNINGLRNLCFDLGIDYEELPGTRKSEMVRELILYCRNKDIIVTLMTEMGKTSPNVQMLLEKQYPWFIRKSPSADFLDGGEPDSNSPTSLGYGINLGGTYEGHDLALNTPANWEVMKDGCKVKSGWLYDSTDFRSVSIAFFKVQAYDDGRASIHIADVAHPEHYIWLTTAVEPEQMHDLFHWSMNPHQVWHFKWALPTPLPTPSRPRS